MNPDQIRRRDAALEARRQRDRLAMAATLAQARKAVTLGRSRAGLKGGLLGFAFAVLSWPFAHMKQK